MRRFERCAVHSASISWRSSSVKSDCVFCGLRIAATMTSSKCRDDRSMMSMCPRVTGSNEPGQRAVDTMRLREPLSDDSTGSSRGQEEHERISELALPVDLQAFDVWRRGAGGTFDHDERVLVCPFPTAQRREHRIERGAL